MRPPVVKTEGGRILVEWNGETRICDFFSAEMARCGVDADRIAIDAWERGTPIPPRTEEEEWAARWARKADPMPEPEPTRGWERVAEGKLEECAPGIYIAGAKAMDPTTRTALLYALGGPPYASRSTRGV